MGERMTNDEALRISREVYDERGPAWDRLAAKCRWEHMPTIAVIREWGDPREWELDCREDRRGERGEGWTDRK